jgi:flagellar biosynthesis component FlhA
LTLFKELEGLTTDPPRFNRRLVRVDELRAKVQQQRRGYQIVASATQLAELRRYSADRRIGTLEGDDAERARQQIQRDTEFITSVRDGAKQVKPVLGEALERIVEGAAKE